MQKVLQFNGTISFAFQMAGVYDNSTELSLSST